MTATIPSTWIKLFLLIVCIFLSGIPVFAQNNSGEREDLWICAGPEIAMFSISNLAYGGGLAIGYGSGTSIGFKISYFIDGGGMVNSLELNILFRFYFFGKDSYSGPFVQLNAGPVLFAQYESFGIPAELGTLSAGLVVGWRYLLTQYFFLEGTLRGGYPYIAGIAFSAGLHF